MSWNKFVIIFYSVLLGGIVSSAVFSSVQAVSSSTGDGDTASSSVVSEDPPKLSPEEEAQKQLQFEIRRKNSELEAIKSAIQKNQEALEKTSGQKASLQKEISVLQRQKSILSKQIMEDQISLERLDLEIRSITYDLQDIQSEISDKRYAIGELLRLIQRSGDENILSIILRSNSLAEGVTDMQSMMDLNSRLAVDIESLRKLRGDYDSRLKNLNYKKDEVEIQNFNLKNRRVILANQEGIQQTLLKETKNQEAVYQAHLKEVYAQQEKIAAEIEALDAKLRGEIDYGRLPSTGKFFIFPISGGVITQNYGATSFAKYGYRGKWHNGIDLRASIGTPVVAAADGKIIGTGDQDKYCPKGAYGKFIAMNHSNGLTTLYGHLSRIVVTSGETVKQGQIIGYSGSTGYATGPHLHFTVFAQQNFKIGGSKSCGPMPQGGDLDPLKYI